MKCLIKNLIVFEKKKNLENTVSKYTKCVMADCWHFTWWPCRIADDLSKLFFSYMYFKVFFVYQACFCKMQAISLVCQVK